MRKVAWLGLVLSAAPLAVSCDIEDPGDPPHAVSGPVALEDALLYATLDEDNETYRSMVLDLQDDEPRVVRGDLPEGEPRLYPRAGHEGEALMLTAGAPARLDDDGEGHDAVPSHLLRFDRDGERQRFQLSASYAALSVSDDGRFAIAHQPGGPWSTADSIAVVDLERDDDARQVEAITVRALDGQGPSAVAFSPSGSPRQLAVLVMSDAINVLDLEHLDRKDKVLPLKLPNGTGSLRAKKVVFAGDRCFVQSDSGSDVFAVRFEEDASGFRASLSTFATESTVQDIVLLEPEGGGSRRLLVVGANGLRLIDTISGKGESSTSSVAFKQAALFVASSPFDDIERPRALLYANDSARIGFVDLQADLTGSERSVEVLSLSGTVKQLVMVEAQGLALAMQSDQRISLINLAERTVSSLSTGAPAKQLLLDQRTDVTRAWVLTESGTLGSIDLGRRNAAEVLLTLPARSLLALPGETPRLVVGHDSETGALTLLDAERPSRDNASEVRGYLYSNYLD